MKKFVMGRWRENVGGAGAESGRNKRERGIQGTEDWKRKDVDACEENGKERKRKKEKRVSARSNNNRNSFIHGSHLTRDQEDVAEKERQTMKKRVEVKRMRNEDRSRLCRTIL